MTRRLPHFDDAVFYFAIVFMAAGIILFAWEIVHAVLT